MSGEDLQTIDSRREGKDKKRVSIQAVEYGLKEQTELLKCHIEVKLEIMKVIVK